MPVYDFRCQECGRVSEVFLRGAKDEVGCCPECGSENLERLLSGTYMIKTGVSKSPGATCCGRAERCETPPCSTGDTCHRA